MNKEKVMKNPKLTITLELEWRKIGPYEQESLCAKNSDRLYCLASAHSYRWCVHVGWVDNIKGIKGECKSVLAGKRKILKYLRDNGFITVC